MQLKREIKFETLRKSHKKQIIIGSVFVCVVGSILTFNLTKAKYRLTQSMKLVTGTINYKVPDLRVVAVNISEDGTNYEIVDDIPESGYTLNEEKSICKVATEASGIENAPKDENITIEYVNGLINIVGVTKRNTRCYLYFDKYVPPTSETTLAKLNINLSYIKEGNPDFSKTATGAETEEDNGIYKMADPMYGENAQTYYWRGAATSNHVIFANKCWRIVRINGDGSIRLIYNGVINGTTTCNNNQTNSVAVTSQAYNENVNNSAYTGYTYTVSKQRPDPTSEISSNLKTQTEDWFNNNITEANLDKLDLYGKYCNDRNTKNNEEWRATGNTQYYATYARLVDAKIPTLSCAKQDIYILMVGAITADEVSLAGGLFNTSNKWFYLYNNTNYWTMSPYSWFAATYASAFFVRNDGGINNGSNKINNPLGIRPVINLRSDVIFNSGSDGTQNNPYIVQ